MKKLHSSREADAAKKIAVFKMIQNKVGFANLPGLPEEDSKIVTGRGMYPDKRKEHYQMELYKRQQEILSKIRQNPQQGYEPLPKPPAQARTKVIAKTWEPNITAVEKIESLDLEDQLRVLSKIVVKKNHEVAESWKLRGSGGR